MGRKFLAILSLLQVTFITVKATSLEDVILQQVAVSGDVPCFRNDSLLIQQVDKANGQSTYKFLGDDSNLVAYERKVDDSGKDVILLSGGQVAVQKE